MLDDVHLFFEDIDRRRSTPVPILEGIEGVPHRFPSAYRVPDVRVEADPLRLHLQVDENGGVSHAGGVGGTTDGAILLQMVYRKPFFDWDVAVGACCGVA